jgi:lambda repressor-like predicted transcriptional regulator
MPANGTLKRLSEERGVSIEDMIRSLLKKYKAVYLVASVLGVAPYTITNWLNNNGWTYDQDLKLWVKVAEPSTEPHTAA